MARYVRLTSLTDAAIFVNAGLVRSVVDNVWRDGTGAKLSFDEKDAILVKENALTVVKALDDASRT
ncbi:hypothetical protein [Devosia sp.]|uniref:hypothetical protein n=1 Tax=Devosia sp. TaxID=1871048 RepID=UPI001AC170CB|nr:hypothetical protein [Devosia sp.]MBN9310191.1 hypothetical protein [Devosia sp.]